MSYHFGSYVIFSTGSVSPIYPFLRQWRMIDVIFPTFLLFIFNFNIQCRGVPFIYIAAFQEDSKRGSNFPGLLFSLFIIGIMIIISCSIHIMIITAIVMIIIIFLYTDIFFNLLLLLLLYYYYYYYFISLFFDWVLLFIFFCFIIIVIIIVVVVMIIICFVFNLFCKCMY